MNSKILIWVTILLLLSPNIITFTSSQSNISNNSIQEMINNANSGDTIYISSGIYYEHIVVDKPLTIVGDGAETTIVDGMNEDEHIYNIFSDDVSIYGFTIRNCSIGFSGIRVNNDSCNIDNNIFMMCGGGVELWEVEDVVVRNNSFEENTWGIYVHNSMDCIIHDNTINNNVYGVELGYSTADIKYNIFSRNELYGILQLGCNQIKIMSNTISSSGYAIQTYNTNNNTILDNYLHHNRRGISIFKSSKNQIKNNNISYNTKGLYLWRESNNNQIMNNEINWNSIGIYIEESTYNNISNNNILNSLDISVSLLYSSNNTILKNKIISECWDGIELKDSPYNSIIQNKISNHYFQGLHLMLSPHNTVKDNIFNRTSFRIYEGEITYRYNKDFQNFSVILSHWNTHLIENNTIDGEKLLYYKNEDCFDIPKDFGEVVIANCSNFTIQNLDIKDVPYGIQIGFSRDAQIINNNISNHSYDGMSIAFSSNVLIQNNTITDIWGAGVDLYHTSEGINIIGNKMIRTGQGVWMVSCNNTTIKENIINNTLFEDAIQGCINLHYSSNNNNIINNTISKNQVGIFLQYDSNNNLIESNNINNNYQSGIVFYQSYNNIIKKNDIKDNEGNGIFLNEASINKIFQNNISYNDYPAIFIGYSSNRNDINCNIISRNAKGIQMGISSNNNKITSNTISYNGDNGVYIEDSCKYNLIKENNIVSNEYPSFFRYAYPNFWFGNYWDDWDKKTPRPIYGEIRLERLDRIIPWVQFDLKPATEVYDI